MKEAEQVRTELSKLIGEARERALPLLFLLLAAAGCGDGGTRPEADGVFTATLEAPVGHADGAALIELTGDGIADVEPLRTRLWMERTPTGARVLLVADYSGTLRFSVRMANASGMPTATVLEVADADDQLRESLAGYAVKFSR
jgi:hypothetical protein